MRRSRWAHTCSSCSSCVAAGNVGGMDEAQRWVGVGVGAMVRRGNQLLLLRRRGVHGDGTWSTPGGHVDFGESLEQTAAREVLEETGLVVGEVTFLGVTNDVMPDDGKHYVTVWMQCVDAGGDPRICAPHEMDAIGWFAVDELPTPLFTSLRNLLAGTALGPGVVLEQATT